MASQPNATLDPKLKATYDRIMGTGIPSTSQQAQTPPPPHTPTVVSPPPPQPMQPIHPTFVQAPTAAPQVSPMNSMSAPATTKEGSKLMPILFVFLAIVFLLIYAVFWIKFFNVEVPFLPF